MIDDSKSTILKPLVIIYLITIAAQLISLGFGRIDTDASFQSLLPSSLLFLTLLTLPSVWVGIKLGRQIGLGIPLIESLVLRTPDSVQKLKSDLAIATILGLVMGGFLLLMRYVCEPYLPPEIPSLGHRGVLGGLSVSLGAAIAEEVWFRLGLMTFLVWVLTRILSQNVPSKIVIWIVIAFSATCFGIAHLPQLLSYEAGSSFAIGATVFGNIMVGILYGWCYWKRSLIAAIVAHFSVDLVLHVISAAL